MPALILGANATPIPFPFSAPVIELANGFPGGGDEGPVWNVWPDLTLVRCTVQAGSGAADSCEVTRRYGTGNNQVKDPFTPGFQSKTPLDLTGWWLRLTMFGNQGGVVQFVGLIETEAATLTGSATSPSGTQNFTAFGGLKILQKINISTAVFLLSDGSTTVTVGWLPPMNKKDPRGLLVGNRSADADAGGSYYYDGSAQAVLWSHLDYCNYLIDSFIQQDNGPVWTMGGQSDVLDGMQTSIDFGANKTAADALKELINPKYGLDWKVTPTEQGFEITVFALTARSASFAGATMPSNPNTLQVDRGSNIEFAECHVVGSSERLYDKVKVIGKRIVVCGTLWGQGLSAGDMPDDAPAPSAPPQQHLPPTLTRRWSADVEAAYIAATGALDPDACRKNEIYRDVYQHLGAPADWDLDKGAWAVATNADGSLTTGDYQTTMRDTLGWLPFRQGYDYSDVDISYDGNGDAVLESATDNTDGTVEAETSPPMAWIYDSIPVRTQAPQYIQCEHNGIGVGRPHLDWGVFLHASPNHLLALNSWSDTQLQTTLTQPDFDWNTVVATVAIESDHRVALEYDLPANQQAGDGSVMTVVDQEAELWVVLPGTIVSLDKDGSLVKFAGKSQGSPDGPTILRNDVPRLALALAGVVARYTNERGRAQLTIKGFVPWAPLLGFILTGVQSGDTVKQVGGIISSIEWTLGQSPQTVIKTGYA